MTNTTRHFLKLAVLCLIFLVAAQTASAQIAHYTVTFDVTWSAVTHPVDFPPSPHFSGLVGGNHDGTVSFWNTGELASLGMKQMAEWGSQTQLLAEVQAAIDAGQAGNTISGPSFWDVPGSTSLDFELTEDFSLVTLVAMIAPSPDWFIGVRDLDLAPGGVWAEEIVVDLFAFDAGTDSGVSYTSGDQATVPPVPIFAISGYPFEAGVPLGSFTFTKNYVSDVPESGTPLSINAFPNPFNPRTTIAWEIPAAGHLEVEIHDLGGRLVRRLWSGAAPAGPGRVTWDGHDDHGMKSGTGLYLASVTTADGVRTRKISLVK